MIRTILTKNLSLWGILRYQIQHTFCFHYLIQFNNIGVIKKFKNFNFSVSLFKICLVQFTFVNYFYGNLKKLKLHMLPFTYTSFLSKLNCFLGIVNERKYLSFCYAMPGKFDNCKISSSDGFFYFIETNSQRSIQRWRGCVWTRHIEWRWNRRWGIFMCIVNGF